MDAPHGYFIRHGESESGPFEMVRLREMWAAGEIDGSTKFRRTDHNWWIDAEEILMDLEFQAPIDEPEIKTPVAQAETRLPPRPAVVHQIGIGSSSFGCAHCGQSFRMANNLLGEEIGCPSCGEAVTLPPPQILRETKCVCPACAEEILAAAVKCKHCGEFLDGRPPTIPTLPVATRGAQQTAGLPKCQQCGGAMKKKTISSGNCVGLLLALIVFSVGVAFVLSSLASGPFGLLIGLLLCGLALFMGGKRSKVWKCVKCGTIVNRA